MSEIGNRYYARSIGRFTSPDPYKASGGPAEPQSWNRYSYVQGDPVNFNDPRGLELFSLEQWDNAVVSGWGGAMNILSSSSFMYGVDGGFINVGGGVGLGDLEPSAHEQAYAAGVQLQFAVNRLNALGSAATRVSRNTKTVVTSTFSTGEDGASDTSTTWSVYDADGTRLGSYTLDRNTPILLGALPSLRSITPAIYSVYMGVTADGQRYIGITSDIFRRGLEHARNGMPIRQIQGLTDLTYAAAKGAEQALIQQYGLSNLANKINSVSRTNPNYGWVLSLGCQVVYGTPVCPP